MVYEIELNINSDYVDLDDHQKVGRVYENVKLIELPKERNNFCFNYALCDDSLNSCIEAYDELRSSYKQIPIVKAKKGDIISYHELINDEPWEGNVLHFAIIKKTDGSIKGTTIKSKWGEYGIYETTICDVLDIYGNTIVIWRKEK